VALVAIEAAVVGLVSVPGLRVHSGDHPVRGHLPGDAQHTVLAGLQILTQHGGQQPGRLPTASGNSRPSSVREPRKADRESTGRKGVWTAAQAARLSFHADHRLYAAWVLAIVAGLRRGEPLGLKWDRVNLDGGLLAVHWQRTATTRNGAIEKAPKGKSKRTVAVGPLAVAALRAHRVRQEAAERGA